VRQDRSAARRLALRRLLAGGGAASQEALVESLARQGHRVSQTTVSRDLKALGARKRAAGTGGEVYALPGPEAAAGEGVSELAGALRAFVVGIDSSLNLTVLHTPPGAAGTVAAALDRAPLRGVLGSVAGDDTILVITEGERGGRRLARELTGLMED
jgi:transcriptional regulator of arginine metabolism